MVRVRFTADAVSRLASGDVHYAAGTVHDLDDQMADRWIRRGVAVQIAVRPAIPALQVEPTLPPVEVDPEPVEDPESVAETATADTETAIADPVAPARFAPLPHRGRPRR